MKKISMWEMDRIADLRHAKVNISKGKDHEFWLKKFKAIHKTLMDNGVEAEVGPKLQDSLDNGFCTAQGMKTYI